MSSMQLTSANRGPLLSAPVTQSTNANDPVKVVFERRPLAGHDQEFEQWLEAVVRSASTFEGFQGSSVLGTGSRTYLVLLRFANVGFLDAWRGAASIVALLARGDTVSSAADEPMVRNGLETWFIPPGQSAVHVAPKWKMALVTWIALMPHILLLAAIRPAGVSKVAYTALSTAISVSMLTWVVMPRLTRLLAGWLYAAVRAPMTRVVQ